MGMPTVSTAGEAQLSPEHIMQVGLGFWASKTLLSAIEMELFTQLSGHSQDLQTLASRAGLHPRSARDFLDALVSLGFLERTEGAYRNAPDADLFFDKHKPSYIGGILEPHSCHWESNYYTPSGRVRDQTRRQPTAFGAYPVEFIQSRVRVQ
jgi:hypothetical protein